MENKIKFKEAGNGYFIKIFLDEDGNETSRTASFNQGKPGTIAAGYYAEMQDWIKAGGVVEPQYTIEELAEKKVDDALQAWESTKSLCIKYLNDSEIHVSQDPPYPDDVQAWKDSRAVWRSILKSGKVQKVPDKPF